jgi:osmoprotectant transport system permease protein
MRCLFLAALLLTLSCGVRPTVVIGSKAFTESVILGDVAKELAQNAGIAAAHRRELGGTRVLWDALLRGEVDVYAEYTGTLRRETLAGLNLPNDEALRSALHERGIEMSGALGFNDTYAVGMLAAEARRLGLRTLSDLAKHPSLRLGFSNEFMSRGDGWPALRDAYALPQRDVRGLDHDLAYRALQTAGIDATDLYSTDAEIQLHGLTVLEDDRHHFPEYQAVWLYRQDTARRVPELVPALRRVVGQISNDAMSEMNARVKGQHVPEARVAADFLNQALGVHGDGSVESRPARLWRRTREHLTLVLVSLLAAVLVAIPLGILAARRERLGQGLLALLGVVQTIPSLALLVFLIPWLGIGTWPALMALFLYSLLPIVRNTHTGLTAMSVELRESAAALGLPSGARLWRIDLPLASRSILAGIKTSAVINVGTATIGALIGAGGYGQSILTGIRLDDRGLILEGAVPAALLALAMQGLFEMAERFIVPRGLRLER